MPGGSILDSGAFPSHGSSVSGLPGDLELFTVEEVAKLKELGVLNPLDVPGHLPLFLPLVSSNWGKVMSAVLGMPPPNLDTQEIGHSLVVDQDEESVLSDSYSDCHSSTVDSSAMGSKQTAQVRIKNRKLGPPSTKIEMDTSLVKRTSERNHDRECEKSKKSKSQHGLDWPHSHSPQPQTQMGVMNMALMANMRDHTATTVPQIVARWSSNGGWVPVHRTAGEDHVHPDAVLFCLHQYSTWHL